jgi:hypothetical protein
VAAFATPPADSKADSKAPVQAPLSDWTVGGSLDVFYQTGLDGRQGDLWGRSLDATKNQVALGSALLSLSRKPTAKSPFGVTLQLGGGTQFDAINATEPGGKKYRAIHQAYVTYAGPRGLTVDFGQFESWFGYESPLSVNNANFSRSFNWNYGEADYNTGFRVSAPVGDNTVSLYAVQGWNEVEDSNTSKTFGATVSRSLGKNLSGTVNYISGNEGSNNPLSAGGIGFAAPGERRVDAVDANTTYTFKNGSTFTLDGNYAIAEGGKWSGVAGYYTTAFSKGTLTGRLEAFSDSAGLRTGIAETLYSATLTYAQALAPRCEGRLEFRHDNSSQNVFPAGAGFSSSRNTLTADIAVKF